jgi:hypothetical protein
MPLTYNFILPPSFPTATYEEPLGEDKMPFVMWTCAGKKTKSGQSLNEQESLTEEPQEQRPQCTKYCTPE